MTLDEAINNFEPFLENLLKTFGKKPNIYLDPNSNRLYAEEGLRWDTAINNKKAIVQKKLSEDDFNFYLNAIDPIHKKYNSYFQNRI